MGNITEQAVMLPVLTHITRPQARLMKLRDLEVGHLFQYKGADINDWHLVTKVTEDLIIYPGGNTTEERNHRNWGTVEVWAYKP